MSRPVFHGTCVICGITQRIPPSRVSKFKTCSKLCFSKHMSDMLKENHFLTTKGKKWKLNPEQLERKSRRQSGEGNNNYKTGRMRGPDGYVLIGGRRRLREHRVVMEKMIGRELKGSELVHHWDKNPSNNVESNLCLMRCQEAHSRLHRFSDRHKIPMEDLKFEQPWLTP